MVSGMHKKNLEDIMLFPFWFDIDYYNYSILEPNENTDSYDSEQKLKKHKDYFKKLFHPKKY